MDNRETDVEAQELWVNERKGRIGVLKFDARGNRIHKMIDGGKKFHITPGERRLNSEMAATPGQDLFTNGALRPLKLIEGTEDVEKFADNPNHLSEAEMISMLKSQHKVFDKRLSQIQNLSTAERLLELAETPDVDATVRTVTKIKERIAQLNPLQPENPTQVLNPNEPINSGFKPVTLS